MEHIIYLRKHNVIEINAMIARCPTIPDLANLKQVKNRTLNIYA